MIRVMPASEPAAFDAKVRAPGLRAIAELAGERPPRGMGKRFTQVAKTRDEIPADKFPTYWRAALDDLLREYHRVCPYLCLYIPRGTGAPSVDHMVAKSQRWDQVYEWSNYRLASSLVNSRKGVIAEVLDPFDIRDGWFALEFVEHQVVVGTRLPDDKRAAAEATIEQLKLNDEQCRLAREEYATAYLEEEITFDYLTRHAPFVATELQRQGWLCQENPGR